MKNIKIILLIFIIIFGLTSCSLYKNNTEPITINKCSLIYNNNREDFNIVKNYLLKNFSSDTYLSFDYIRSLSLDNITENAFLSLNCKGINSIRIMVVDNNIGTNIAFIIENTNSLQYGILWRVSKNQYASSEIHLEDNWYSYVIGYT